MKGALRMTMLAGAAGTLAACACPATGQYGKTPYDDRTAGKGLAVYEGDCEVAEPVLREKNVVVEEREPVRQAEPIFRERQRK